MRSARKSGVAVPRARRCHDRAAQEKPQSRVSFRSWGLWCRRGHNEAAMPEIRVSTIPRRADANHTAGRGRALDRGDAQRRTRECPPPRFSHAWPRHCKGWPLYAVSRGFMHAEERVRSRSGRVWQLFGRLVCKRPPHARVGRGTANSFRRELPRKGCASSGDGHQCQDWNNCPSSTRTGLAPTLPSRWGACVVGGRLASVAHATRPRRPKVEYLPMPSVCGAYVVGAVALAGFCGRLTAEVVREIPQCSC